MVARRVGGAGGGGGVRDGGVLYFNFDKNYAIFENCKFIDTYSRQYIIERFRSDLTINNCYFTSTNGNVGYEVIGGYKNSVLLINNTIFKNCCRKSDDNIDVYGNCSIFNSQFLEYENPHIEDRKSVV